LLLGAWKVAEGLTRREEFGGVLAREGDGAGSSTSSAPAKRSGTVEMRLGSVGGGWVGRRISWGRGKCVVWRGYREGGAEREGGKGDGHGEVRTNTPETEQST